VSTLLYDPRVVPSLLLKCHSTPIATPPVASRTSLQELGLRLLAARSADTGSLSTVNSSTDGVVAQVG
jgi:hypothetical protein